MRPNFNYKKIEVDLYNYMRNNKTKNHSKIKTDIKENLDKIRRRFVGSTKPSIKVNKNYSYSIIESMKNSSICPSFFKSAVQSFLRICFGEAAKNEYAVKASGQNIYMQRSHLKDIDKLIHKDEDKLIPKDEDKLIPKDEDKLIPKDEDKLIPKDEDKLIPKDEDKLIPKDEDKIIPKDEDIDKIIHEESRASVYETMDLVKLEENNLFSLHYSTVDDGDFSFYKCRIHISQTLVLDLAAAQKDVKKKSPNFSKEEKNISNFLIAIVRKAIVGVEEGKIKLSKKYSCNDPEIAFCFDGEPIPKERLKRVLKRIKKEIPENVIIGIEEEKSKEVYDLWDY